jgi:hypothetical protein
MKKLIAMAAAIILFSACDDGDMTLKTFNFGSATAQTCSNGLLFKVNGTEALILDLQESAFANVETGPEGRTITIGTSGNTIRYRNYSGNVSSSSLCADLPPATPVVTEEWIGIGGTIKVITTALHNNSSNPGLVTGYSHAVTLVNVTFTKEEETIIINDNDFGTITTTLDYAFEFEGADNTYTSCNDLVYRIRLNEALILDLDGIIQNVNGTATVDLANTLDANNVIFNVYSANASAGNICSAIPAIAPVVTQRWYATGGTLKIDSVLDGTNTFYTHTLTLQNAVFTNSDGSGESFSRSGDYILGTYITTL